MTIPVKQSDPIPLRPHAANFNIRENNGALVLDVTFETEDLGDFIVPLSPADADRLVPVLDAFAGYAQRLHDRATSGATCDS